MPLSHLHDLTDDVLARAARIRLACFDVDGTLTDGRLYLDSEGREQKTFHVQDGQGLVLLKRAGIEVAFITARGGTVECKPQKPERDCNERSLLRRYGAGVKVLTMWYEETYTEYREEVVVREGWAVQGGAITLDGGVGGRVF